MLILWSELPLALQGLRTQMALYQEYETKILTEKGINIQNDGIKEIIQLYDPEQALQLPVEPLERIQDFLDDYNELIGQTFKLRYYQQYLRQK